MKRSTSITIFAAFSLVTTAAIYTSQTLHWPLENELYLAYFDGPELRAKNADVLFMSKPNTCQVGAARQEDIPADVFEDFLAANSLSSKPIRLIKLEGLVDVVAWESTLKLWRNDYVGFMIKDNVLFQLSRAGFNKNRTEAIFCIESRSNTYAKAALVRMKLSDGVWELVDEYLLWLT